MIISGVIRTRAQLELVVLYIWLLFLFIIVSTSKIANSYSGEERQAAPLVSLQYYHHRTTAMDRYERVKRQGESLRPARLSVINEWRRLESTGNSQVRGNQEVRALRVQRVARVPEPRIRNSETQRGHQSTSSSWSGRAGPGRILLVHGLGRDFNCDKIFNLFCIYGNVTAVKILRNYQVLVELNDAEAAQRCLSNLHLLPLDENNILKVKYSKHSCIFDSGIVKKLSDGTPAQKNYKTSQLHRFPITLKLTDQRRIAAPSKILHFFNAPLDVSGSMIHRAVTNALGCDDAVQSVTILPHKQPSAKCSTGLIEMKSIELAAKAILLLNHMTFESSGCKVPSAMKICFSKWSKIHEKSDDLCSLVFSTTPRDPWPLHKSERIVPVAEFPVSQMTLVTNGNNPWTLWDLRKRATEAFEPEAGCLVETETEHDDQVAEPEVEAAQAAGDA